MSVTVSNIIHAINKLDKNIHYNYIDNTTTTKIIIDEVRQPEGPIYIKRYDPNKGKGTIEAIRTSISSQMLLRIANAVSENYPINIDRILGASYNTRSALEALLAYTPEFYYCYPGRIQKTSTGSKVVSGHKHLLYRPDNPHAQGVIVEAKTDFVISEIPTAEAVYDAIEIPVFPNSPELDIDIQRRHAQIQIALLFIGVQLGSSIWVAQNDRGIQYRGSKLCEIEGVINDLKKVQQIQAYHDAQRAASYIDVIWFRNSRFMPAVFEIEHTTGVVRGLSRMMEFKSKIPPIDTRWVIVGEESLRSKVIELANQNQYKDMNTRFMSYGAVEELFSLCQRRRIKGINDDFLDCFMEYCVVNG
jgi:type II restriction enzyme